MKYFNTKVKQLVLSVVLVLIAQLSVNAQLNGTYTVYGAGADYPTLQDAVNALNAGVSGPVIFNIRPGNWTSATTSTANLGNVSGASSTNTITFQAENGSAATTTITNSYASSSTTLNHIFYFNSASYITVRNLTLARTNATYACAVRFAGSAAYNTVENCIITGGATSTSSANYRIYGTSLTNAHHNTIKNNKIDEGYYGIYWSGNSTTSVSSDNVITGNTLTNVYTYGIYNYYTSNHEVSNNTITSKGTGNTFYGVFAYYSYDGFKFDNNNISRTGVTTSGYYPMYIYYSDGTAANRGSISGNTINVSSSTTIYGMRVYYCNYYSLDNNNVTINTSGSAYPLYNYNYNSNTGFQYGKDCYIEGNTFNVNAGSTVYMYGHYYYQSNPKFNNNTVNIDAGAGTVYLYLSYYYQYNPEFNGNKITVSGTTGTKYVYANYYYGEEGFEYNNNEITFNTTTGTCYNYAGYYTYYNQEALHYNNNKITMTASSTGAVYNYLGYYDYNNTAAGNEMMNNEVTLSTTGTAAYNYMGYYFDGLNLSNNKVNVQSNGAAYGIYSYGKSGGSNPWKVQNNNVKAIGGTSTVYGFYNYYASDAIISNNVIYARTNGTCYGYLGGYNNGGGRYYNNTIHTEGSGTKYTFYCYTTSNSQFATVRNNVFSRSTGGSGYLMYGYQPQFYDMDYNNLWNNGAAMWYFGGLGTSYGSVTAMRTGTGQHMNSLSYDPGFMNVSTGDLKPDPTNPNSWSLNGRGMQIPGNGTDINGSARALTTIQGVPDLGAYEFTPTSTPPNCTMTPATPTPSSTQTVTFGEDTVAVLQWGAAVPSSFAVKQYTGTNPPGITSINPTQMFYYVDFQGTGTNLDYKQDLYFKEPWLGTIASKSALRLAEKVGTGSWTGYAPANSVSNIVRNFIATPSVMDVGALFTGIDVGNNASADAIVEPVSPFCPGTYNVKLRIKNNGNNTINSVKIAWELNGVAKPVITYTTPIQINGSTQGNVAIIDLGPVAFGAAAVNIKAWTFEPNNVQDPIPSDDTLKGDYFAALGGLYTVGGLNPDFPTVVAAANALSTYGTCGDVVFDVRPGTYTGQVILKNNSNVGGGTAHVTFRSVNNNPATTKIEYFGPNSTGGGIGVVLFENGASKYKFQNLGIEATNASYGYGVEFGANASNDTFENCRIAVSTATSSYNRPVSVTSTSQSGCNYNTFTNCDLVGGYYSVYWYTSASPYSRGLKVDNCSMSPYYYGLWYYYAHALEATNNTITARQPGTSYYGMYLYMYPQNTGAGSSNISNNRIKDFYGYSMYATYIEGSANDRSKIMNNSIIGHSNSICYYPMMLQYPSYTDVLNNTVINNGTSSQSYYAAYLYLSNYGNNRIYNNVFANMAGGNALYVYYLNGYNNVMNYNNLYTTSNSLFITGTPSATSLNAWRTTTGMDMQSVTYDPAMTSATDPTPDVTNPAVWALNGHGFHFAGYDKDIDGKTRAEVRPDGVPDIGAYEINPEVMPPAATATPAVADKGTTQVFTFAGNEVGRITWGYNAPVANVTVHQYSGERAAGVAVAANPSGSMYFHTDIVPQGVGTSYDFSVNVDYMDIWMGDIPNDNNLRLAHKVTSYPWMVYSGSLSSVNTTSKDIDATDLNRFGAYTGLENNAVPSSFVRPQGGTIICIGNSVTINAEPNNGDYYKWSRNGVAIPGAEGANYKSYTATTAGDYSVAITFTGKVVESVPVTVSTIAAPNAIINASGPLTYCTGSGLTLDAGSATGVTYQWQLNGNDIPNATNSTYAVGQAGQYTVVATNIGCSSVSTATSITAGPIKVDLGNDTSYCEIKNVYMKLDAGFVGAKYLWNTGDTSRVIEVKQGGKYSVRVDGGPNCIGTDDIQVTIDPLPKANGISFVQNGNDYQFFASGAVGATGFLWLFSDGTTSTMPQPSKTLKTEDLYVRLVMFNACGSDTVQLGWPLSVSAIAEGEGVRIYPNPATTQVTIDAGTVNMESVEILNSVGAVVYRASDMNTTKHSADISTLANGHYMMRATTESGTLTKQFDVLK